MNTSAPENVYRKPYEWYSCLTAVFGIILLINLSLPLYISVSSICFIALFIALRFAQGLRIVKFRRSARKLPYYALKANQIPVSKHALFLGKGFRWTQVHTQRLFLIRQPHNQHLLFASPMEKRIREYEKLHDNWITTFTRSNKWWNPYAPLPPVGGSTELHGVEIKEENIWSSILERVGHMFVVGTTRVGKTRLAETILTQDIKRGDTVIFFDPKGDADVMLKMFSEANKANRPFYMFHLGFPEHSCRYNPIGDYTRITEIATRLANQLPGEGQSAAFKEFVWRFVNVLAKTMEALSIKPTYNDLYRCASNVDELAQKYFELFLDKTAVDWREDMESNEEFKFDKKQEDQAIKTGRSPETMKLATYIKSQNYNDTLSDALMTILSNDRSYFEKLVSSLYPLLEKLTTGQIAELLSPDPENLSDQRPLMDWRKVIQSNAVVYVGLDALSDQAVAGAVGNAMFSDLTSFAGQIYKHGIGYGQSGKTEKRVISIHADEFNELIGDEFIPLLNKAGGAGFQVTVYTQTLSDVEAKIGSPAKAAQISGNLNTLIMLRVKEKDTALLLTDQLPEVKVLNSTLVSGANDTALPENFEDFGSRNEDRIGSETVPMLTHADLISLPKGQAFALIEGGQLYKIRLPLPIADPEDQVPAHLEAMANIMRDKIRLSQKAEDMANENTAFVDGDQYGK